MTKKALYRVNVCLIFVKNCQIFSLSSASSSSRAVGLYHSRNCLPKKTFVFSGFPNIFVLKYVSVILCFFLLLYFFWYEEICFFFRNFDNSVSFEIRFYYFVPFLFLLLKFFLHFRVPSLFCRLFSLQLILPI